jgi:hypothetical protein
MNTIKTLVTITIMLSVSCSLTGKTHTIDYLRCPHNECLPPITPKVHDTIKLALPITDYSLDWKIKEISDNLTSPYRKVEKKPSLHTVFVYTNITAPGDASITAYQYDTSGKKAIDESTKTFSFHVKK